MARRIVRFGWVALIAALFLGFHFWYAGTGRPLAPGEAEAMLDRARANLAQSGAETQHPEFRPQLEALAAGDDGREFFMVNLETFREGEEALAADAAYARVVVPLLLRRGSFPVYVGAVEGPVLGQYAAGLTRVAIVRYRSLRDFLDMNADPRMAEGAPHKFASLAHTEVFVTKPRIVLLGARLAAVVLALVLAAGGYALIGRLWRAA